MLNTLKNWIENDLTLEAQEIEEFRKNGEHQEFFTLKEGAISEDKSAILGRGGHLFINEGSNSWSSQLKGDLIISNENLEKSKDFLSQTFEKSAIIGCDFVTIFVPEKDTIYSQYSPNSPNHQIIGNSVDLLRKECKVRIVFPKNELMEASSKFEVFHKRNSHLNIAGGIILTNSLLHEMNLEPLSPDEFATKIVRWPDDLSLKWDKKLYTSRRIFGNPYIEKTIVDVVGHIGKHILLTNPNLRNSKTCVIYGDSYSWNPDAGLARFMTLRFENVHFIWSRQIDWELLDTLRPDNLILESAERFLIRGIFRK